jgi:tetratricopeptide (TPR) repeat protein
MSKDRVQEFPIEAFRATDAAAKLETADDLDAAGNDALDRGDATAAEALFRQATEKEAGHKFAWNNLGLALRQQKRYEEALKAFSRQIEVNPYDPYSYDNRGAVLAFDLGRADEGEKDFLKQMEVTPLEPMAYRDLASVRTTQRRFGDAADLLDRAAAAKPSHAPTWLQLAWARARAGKGDVAGPAGRAVATSDQPRQAIVAARAMAVVGDAAAAARIAREALPKLIADLQSTDKSPDGAAAERDVLFLGEAWRLIGSAALAAGDLTTADRYLTAAYDIAFTEDAALELAELREKQGRRKEAADLREQAPTFSRGRAGSLRMRTQPANATGPYPSTFTLTGASSMIGLRHIKNLPGPPPSERVNVWVRLTVDADGKVTDVRATDPKDDASLKPLRDRIVGLSIISANPDRATFKVTRGAVVTCFQGMTCHLGISILADEVASVLER